MHSLTKKLALATLAIAAAGYISAQVPARINPQNAQKSATQTASATSAQQSARTAKKDSVVIAIKLNKLRTCQDELQSQIKEQDSKRDRQIPGVAPETLATMNDRQDSICLALRSELVGLNLQINELAPAQVSSQVLNQFQNIVSRQPADSAIIQASDPAANPSASQTPVKLSMKEMKKAAKK